MIKNQWKDDASNLCNFKINLMQIQNKSYVNSKQ